jgi:molybdopterin/thiamine biosynthesis adenylyltransferase
MTSAVEVNATSKYHLGNIVEEGEQPPPEISSDVFDRQRVMKNFHQCSIEQQHAFILGVGGIGSSIAISLVRMGVDTIYLLDRDTVDASNLNRQILFSRFDVGKSKVEVAAQHLKDMHNLRTNIYEYHIDAVTKWACVVEIAKKCTVIFNNIDYGAVFDYAVNSLCKSLGIVYVAGSTYANNIDINLFSGLLNDPCWACNNNTNDSFKFTTEELENRNDIQLFFKEMCCISGEESQSVIEECLNELNLNQPSVSQLSTLFISLYQQKILRLLIPQFIQNHSSIEFIPKDRSFPTRTVGSWVGVCVSGACLIVNTWMQYIMKAKNLSSDTNHSFHNWSQLNLSMFDGGYYTAGYPNEQDLKSCPICSNAKQMAKQNSYSEKSILT